MSDSRTIQERFDSKYEVHQCGCWLWQAGISQQGYGKFKMNGRTVGAHRASYVLHKGAIPKGLFVCHSCDVRHCVNPDHLWLGTCADNHADRNAKGRQAKGRRHGITTLTEQDVRFIREELRQKPRGIQKALAEKYGVNRLTINRIQKRETWRHVA